MSFNADTHDIASVEAPVLSEHVEEAVRMFRDYRWARYGLLMVCACVVNAVGLGLSIWLRPVLDLKVMFLVFVVVVGPTWLCYAYFLAPSRMGSKITRSLPKAVRASMDGTNLVLSSGGKDGKLPWGRVKAVLEGTAVFVLVLSPFAFLLLPREAVGEQLREALCAKAVPRAA